MRYRLSTLLILTTLGPPMIAVAWWLWNEGGWIMLIPLSMLFAPAIGRLIGRIATRRKRREAIAGLKARGFKFPKGFDDKQ